jgi:uncharacterized integral membrane protein
MIGSRWVRWGGLTLIGIVAALVASFNAGERVALNLGFATLYRIPLVPLILGAFVLGMVTMFLLGLRHDLRVRRALRDAGFGEPIAAPSRLPEAGADEQFSAAAPEDETLWAPPRVPPAPADDLPPHDPEPPPRYPP